MKEFIIYGLRDPNTDEYRYIGKSNSGLNRPKAHLTFSHNQSVNIWAEELRSVGLSPLIDVIEECEEDELVIKERFWIQYFENAGCRLFNSIKYYGHAIEALRKDVEEERKRLENILKGVRAEIEEFDTLGGFVKKVRKMKKIKQEDLANKIGISTRSLYQIENNQGNPTLESITSLLNVLGYKLAPIEK